MKDMSNSYEVKLPRASREQAPVRKAAVEQAVADTTHIAHAEMVARGIIKIPGSAVSRPDLRRETIIQAVAVDAIPPAVVPANTDEYLNVEQLRNQIAGIFEDPIARQVDEIFGELEYPREGQ